MGCCHDPCVFLMNSACRCLASLIYLFTYYTTRALFVDCFFLVYTVKLVYNACPTGMVYTAAGTSPSAGASCDDSSTGNTSTCVSYTGQGFLTGSGCCSGQPGRCYNFVACLQSSCVTCAAGAWCPGDASMQACAAGKFTNITGASMCSACAAGTYSVVGASICLACVAGSSCPGGSMMNACAAGKFSALDGAVACSNCPAGTYSGVVGATQCLNCSTGASTFQGKYAPSAGASVCLTCASPSSFSSSDGLTCIPDSTPGGWCGSGGYKCNAGTFCKCSDNTCPSTNTQICRNCTTGRFSGAIGAYGTDSAQSNACAACTTGM